MDPIPDPAAVARQNTTEAYPGCQSTADDTEVRSCTLGVRSGARRTVALVGDSHATQWFSAFDELGRQRDWQVRTFTRSSCPFSDARRVQPGETIAGRGPLCNVADREVERRLLADPSIDTVFVSAYASAYDWAQAPGTDLADPATDGFRSAWRRLTEAGKQVVVIRDVPAVKDRVNAPDCLAQHPGDPVACALPRSAALTPDVEAAAVTGAPRGVRLVDLTSHICDARLCYVVVGDVIVYRDYSHLSKEYSTLLAPYLARAFDTVDAPVG